MERGGGGRAGARQVGGVWRDAEGHEIEDFGLAENLMLEGAIAASGGIMLRAESTRGWTDLEVFERCLLAAKSLLLSEL